MFVSLGGRWCCLLLTKLHIARPQPVARLTSHELAELEKTKFGKDVGVVPNWGIPGTILGLCESLCKRAQVLLRRLTLWVGCRGSCWPDQPHLPRSALLYR
jgi:hypothetical protein